MHLQCGRDLQKVTKFNGVHRYFNTLTQKLIAKLTQENHEYTYTIDKSILCTKYIVLKLNKNFI